MRIAIILEAQLPPGLAANAAAAMAISLGRRFPEIVGPGVVDGEGVEHPGILNLPVPVLRAGAADLARIRAEAEAAAGLEWIDFTKVAQASKTYPEYVERLGRSRGEELACSALCLFGEDVGVARLTGGLPLYR